MSICQEPWNLLWNLVASGMSKYLSCRSRGCLCFACIVVEKSGNSKTWFLVFLLRLRPCLGQRWRRLNAISGKNPAERLASDLRSPNACSAKRGSLNCAEENRRSELWAAFAFKRHVAGVRGPKQGLRSLRQWRFSWTVAGSRWEYQNMWRTAEWTSTSYWKSLRTLSFIHAIQQRGISK